MTREPEVAFHVVNSFFPSHKDTGHFIIPIWSSSFFFLQPRCIGGLQPGSRYDNPLLPPLLIKAKAVAYKHKIGLITTLAIVLNPSKTRRTTKEGAFHLPPHQPWFSLSFCRPTNPAGFHKRYQFSLTGRVRFVNNCLSGDKTRHCFFCLFVFFFTNCFFSTDSTEHSETLHALTLTQQCCVSVRTEKQGSQHSLSQPQAKSKVEVLQENCSSSKQRHEEV